jgi:integrase
MAKKPPLKITKRNVSAAPVPADRDEYYWDPDLKGFGLRVTPRGVKSYVVQYRLRSRPARRLTLGIHGSPWTAEKAREEAQSLLIEVKKGNDPIETKRRRERDAKNLEFSGYVDRFVNGYLKEAWADSWQDAERRLKTHVVPHLKGRALPEISAKDIGAVMDELRPQAALARNTDAVLRLLFRWAAEPERKDIEHSPMVGMRRPKKPKDRKRVLSPDELVAVWRASFDLESERDGRFVRLLLLTLQRRNEVAGVPWTELRREESRWYLAGERAKNEEDHLVHLNTLAMAELDAIGWKRRGLVFPAGKGETALSGFSKLKRRLNKAMIPVLQELADRRAEVLGDEAMPIALERWTFHDLRRSGTTALQALGFPVEVTEKVINHKSGEVSGIKKVYNLWAYEPEKRAALNAWGQYLGRLIDAAEKNNVIALSARAA